MRDREIRGGDETGNEVFMCRSKGTARRKSDRAQNDGYAHAARRDSFGGDNPIRRLLKSFKKQYIVPLSTR